MRSSKPDAGRKPALNVTEARQVAAPHTNFLANYREPGDGASGGAGEHAHSTVEVNDGIMRLGALVSTKQLSRELVLQAASFVRRSTQRATESNTDPMRTSHLADSGASRDGVPKGYFPPPGAGAPPARVASVSSSNGITKAIIQKLRVPRLLPGGATAEACEVLHIRGPPVLSMGRMVEEADMSTCFVYAQG